MVRSFSYQSYVLHVACQHTPAGGRGHEEWNGWGDEGGCGLSLYTQVSVIEKGRHR